jgi:DNA-damage-inducible protein J
MARTAMVQARIEPDLKNRVEHILKILGMNTSDAITMFFKQVQLRKGIPFNVRIPHKDTRKAITEARRGKGKKFTSSKSLFSELAK